MAAGTGYQPDDRHRLGRAAGVRGARPALQAADESAGQYDQSRARAAGRHPARLAVRPAAIDARLYRYPAAAGHRLEELDPADRLRHRGDGQGDAQASRDHRCGPQARAADRHDHRRDDGGHGPDRAIGRTWFGRWRLARAHGHGGDRRPAAVDRADAADRARRLQSGRWLRKARGAVDAPPPADLQ